MSSAKRFGKKVKDLCKRPKDGHRFRARFRKGPGILTDYVRYTKGGNSRYTDETSKECMINGIVGNDDGYCSISVNPTSESERNKYAGCKQNIIKKTLGTAKLAMAQADCGEKQTVFRVIPCEKCGNDTEEEFAFLKGAGDLSDCVVCNKCGKKSLQLYYEIEESDDNHDGDNDDENSEISDDVEGFEKLKVSCSGFDGSLEVDGYCAESIGSSDEGYKYEMKKAFEKQDISEQPVLKCLKCNAFGNDKFVQMLDGEGHLAWWKCVTCNEEYDQNGRLEPGTGQFKIKPCSSCQTDDPNHFIIHECAESKDIVLVCGWCDVIHHTLVEAKCPGPRNVQCQCGNEERNLFGTESDENGNITNVKCLVCDREQDLTNESPITCTKCDNNDPDMFQLIDNDLGHTKKAICQGCQTSQEVEKGSKLLLAPHSKKGQHMTVKVLNCERLKMGDHIAFHRNVGYWHHAIVVLVDEVLGHLKLLEYSPTGEKKKKIAIQEHWVDIDWVKDAVYCIQYEPGQCSDPEEVIKRARSRVGEHKYNLFTNNCEHFAVWAKSGQRVSHQVKEFKKVAVNNGIQWVIGNAVNIGAFAARRLGTCLIKLSVPALGTEGVEVFAGVAGLSALDLLSCGMVVALQAAHTGYKIYKGHKERKTKERDIENSQLTDEAKCSAMNKAKHEFHEKVVDEVAQGTWQAAWTISGFTVGQILIPVPILGGFVGGVLGSLIGIASRQFVGKQAVKCHNALRKKRITEK